MAWPHVGGIIAARRNGAEPGSAPNIDEFNKHLNDLWKGKWYKDYRYVEPWDTAEITNRVNELIQIGVEVIVVTGTTIGERVLAARNASHSDVWIVAATDDGDWVCTFEATYPADHVTGVGSGYNDITERRIKNMISKRALGKYSAEW